MRRTTKWLAAVIAVTGLAFTSGAATAGDLPSVAYTPKPHHPGPHYPGPHYPGPFPPRHADHDYVVYVKRPFSGHWQFYGKYETRHQAERVEWVLERHGTRVRIERVHDHRPFPW
jgi:hypothetical protein